MPCFHPIKGYRLNDGGVTLDGQDPRRAIGQTGDNLASVPCGQCLGCLMRRTRDWAIRMRHEAKSHKRNCFLTLTYDGEHLPADGSLDLVHWQRFADRMRKRMGAFRYYHCGEYGPQTLRPHYHACVFGLDFSSDWRPTARSKSGELMYESKVLEELWPMGYATAQPFTEATAAYTAGYVVEKAEFAHWCATHEKVNPHTGEVWEVRPAYATMSKRPGIGSEWLKKYADDIYLEDFAISASGQRARPPRYYDRKLKEEDPERFAEVEARRREKAQKHDDDQLEIQEMYARQRREMRNGGRSSV